MWVFYVGLLCGSFMWVFQPLKMSKFGFFWSTAAKIQPNLQSFSTYCTSTRSTWAGVGVLLILRHANLYMSWCNPCYWDTAHGNLVSYMGTVPEERESGCLHTWTSQQVKHHAIGQLCKKAGACCLGLHGSDVSRSTNSMTKSVRKKHHRNANIHIPFLLITCTDRALFPASHTPKFQLQVMKAERGVYKRLGMRLGSRLTHTWSAFVPQVQMQLLPPSLPLQHSLQ